MEKKIDYPYVRAYYELTGLQDYHVKDFVALAQKDGAPPDAAFRDKDGAWKMIKDVKPVILKQMKERI